MKDINQVLLNPIRSRIIQYLALNKTATAGELVTIMTDIPKTTLYRHLNILADNSVIMVVEENRIRGSVERTYSLNMEALTEMNSVDNAVKNAYGFLMKIYGDFVKYFDDPKADPAADKIFLSNISLLLTDNEFNDLLMELNSLLGKHLNNKPSESRRHRSISFISSPSDNERKIDNEN